MFYPPGSSVGRQHGIYPWHAALISVHPHHGNGRCLGFRGCKVWVRLTLTGLGSSSISQQACPGLGNPSIVYPPVTQYVSPLHILCRHLTPHAITLGWAWSFMVKQFLCMPFGHGSFAYLRACLLVPVL